MKVWINLENIDQIFINIILFKKTNTDGKLQKNS